MNQDHEVITGLQMIYGLLLELLIAENDSYKINKNEGVVYKDNTVAPYEQCLRAIMTYAGINIDGEIVDTVGHFEFSLDQRTARFQLLIDPVDHAFFMISRMSKTEE